MEKSNVLGIAHELSKESKVSRELFEYHVSKLQESVGLKSGTVQDLSSKNLKKLASNASQPSEFLAKVKDAQSVSNLVPMMEVLGDICKDTTLKTYIAKKCSTVTGTSTDFQKLKEKLLQQVGSKNFAEPSDEPRRQKRLFPQRPFLTLDFLHSTDLIQSTKIGQLGMIPVQSQESAVIEDLLFCLVGVEGTHIKPSKKNSDSKLTFTIDDSLDPSLKELLHRILPLCNAYSTVVQFAEDKIQLGSGRVNQALAGAINQILKDYLIFVSQLEAQHKKGGLSLNKIWFYVQPALETMTMLSEVCQSVNKMDARGGKTLSLLYNQMISQSSNENCKLIMEFLAKKAAKPYFEILTKWIHRGVIIDGGKDFFVDDNEVIERTNLPLEYSDDYWERRYSFRSDQIPSFLHMHSDMILRTGKYLNVIQQCDKSIQWPENVEDIVFQENPEDYIQPLERAYAFASKTLMELLVRDKDLIGHLRSVKHYFLLNQGDFIVQFMDLCEAELLQNVNSVEPARLESLLELAQRTSAANSDPYKDNVGVELLPYDLIYQMCKILSIDTDAEAEFKSVPPSTSELSGLEAFAFGYEVQWPVSLVLNRKSLACYQMLLRHLFFCKHVERKLCGAWIRAKSSKPSSAKTFKQTGPSYALRQKMLNFLQNLEYYMTFEVLEPNWELMISRIREGKVENVDQVLKIHSDFLSMCLNDCMLSNLDLLTNVKKILGISLEFADFCATNEASSKMKRDDFQEAVNRYELRFSSSLISLLDKISRMGRENYNERVLNILNRLDFNGFYSKDLEKFGCNSSNTS